MIYTYSKYLNTRLAQNFLVVLSLCGVVIWLTQSLRFVDLIAAKGVEFIAFLKIIFFLVLPMTYVCIPIAFLLAMIITIHYLNDNNEIVALKSFGVSNFMAFRAYLPATLIIIHTHINHLRISNII